MNKIYILLILFILSIRLDATFLFQNQNVEAKDVGLNGSAMMTGKGIEGIFYNPAVVNSVLKSQILLNYSMMNTDFIYFLIGAKYNNFKILGNSMAFYLRGLYSDNFGYVTSGYSAERSFSISEYQGGINYSVSKLKKVLFGININFGNEDYFIYKNRYLSIDAGAVVKVNKFIEIVWVGKNIELYSENSDLTAIHSIGLRYDINIKNSSINIFPILKISSNYIEKIIGIEYNYNNILEIYAGSRFNPYLVDDVLNHISGGLSVGYKFIKISYGFKPSLVVGDIHSFSISYTF